jgi:putative spermidine/putrescine transport system ATP-binding protein
MRHAASITLDSVVKLFDGGVRAVDGVSAEIKAGEFFALLGPSGCGKTTTLRLIAGFEQPDAGRILVAGEDITALPPHRRGMSMVFQNYALFPHRTVFENVAFGLRMRSVGREETAKRVTEALRLVALDGLEARRPSQLSGGQQQRVALARAIVVEPAVLLCDEPLGALDKKLRQAMQFELKQLQRQLGVTLVFVTHDQEEALAMSDRVAVMREGKVEQLGAPAELYDRPATRFVADFLGDANVIEGVVGSDGLLATDGLAIRVPDMPAGPAAIALRPERVRLDMVDGLSNRLSGTVENVNFLGGAILYRVALTNRRLLLSLVPNHGGGRPKAPGDAVTLGWNVEDAVVLKG